MKVRPQISEKAKQLAAQLEARNNGNKTPPASPAQVETEATGQAPKIPIGEKIKAVEGNDTTAVKDSANLDLPVKTSEDALAVEGDQPVFLGQEVTPQFVQGLRVFTRAESPSPFVDLTVEGARVLLNDRNFGRAERKEDIEGFVKSDDDKAGFAHQVYRHGHGSLKRGEEKAGVYNENVDVELIDRETVRSWDRASLSYDHLGRIIFRLEKDFDVDVGNDTSRKPKKTKTNRVILTHDGKITTGQPVSPEKKGWVSKTELSARGDNFAELIVQKSTNDQINRLYEPFLPGGSDIVRTHLYRDRIPFDIVNRRTQANFKEEAPSSNVKLPGSHQEEITILQDGKAVKVMAIVAEMSFEEPVGIREKAGPDGKHQRIPLYFNRTYIFDGKIIGGYPIKEFGEPSLDESVWNLPLRKPSSDKGAVTPLNP
jgi:hypothetical protein